MERSVIVRILFTSRSFLTQVLIQCPQLLQKDAPSIPEGSEVLREEVPMAKRPRMMCPREGIITLDDDDDEYDSDSEPAVVVKEKKKADTPLKPLISVAGGSEDWCKSSTPFFYLTKVQGLSSRYNGCDMALGIKGLFSLLIIHHNCIDTFYVNLKETCELFIRE